MIHQHPVSNFTPRICPKCGGRMFPLKSIPPQDRCQKCRWIIVTTGLEWQPKRNRGRGRPFAKGNTLRPATSGMQKIFTDPVSLTIKVERADRDQWQREAQERDITLGEYIRDNMQTNPYDGHFDGD